MIEQYKQQMAEAHRHYMFFHMFSLFPIGYPNEVKEQQDRFVEARIHYVR